MLSPTWPSGGRRGTGATLIGARVTSTCGFSSGGGAERVQSGWLYVGAEPVSAAGGGGGGGGGGGSGGGALIGVGAALLGTGWADVDGFGATDVDCSGLVAESPPNASRTIGTATAAVATAIRAIFAGLVRYHGGGGDLNVNVLLFEARS